MDQPADIRDLSARRPGSASVIELRSPSQLRPDLRDAIEPIQRKFGRPELVIREHTNNTVRWKQGERLNHLQFLTIRQYLSLVFITLVGLLLVVSIWT